MIVPEKTYVTLRFSASRSTEAVALEQNHFPRALHGSDWRAKGLTCRAARVLRPPTAHAHSLQSRAGIPEGAVTLASRIPHDIWRISLISSTMANLH